MSFYMPKQIESLIQKLWAVAQRMALVPRKQPTAESGVLWGIWRQQY